MGSKRFTAPRLKKCANTNEDKDMSRTRLTNRERFDIESFIARNGDETELGWKYRANLSDEAVAEQFGATRQTVAAIRSKTFGNLAGHASRSGGKMAELLERLEAVEQRLQALDQSTNARQPTWKDKSNGNGIISSERAKACL